MFMDGKTEDYVIKLIHTNFLIDENHILPRLMNIEHKTIVKYFELYL